MKNYLSFQLNLNISIKALFLPLAFFLLNNPVFSQDEYHAQLQNTFQSEYNLPVGNWIFFDNEIAILNEAVGYNGAFSTIESTNTVFSKIAKATISNAGANPWDAGWNLRNKQRISANDKVLMVFSIRSIGGEGKVNIFAENATTYDKEVFLTVDIAEEWTQYFVRFDASKTFDINTITFGFHLAHQAQTLEIGGFTAVNFGQNVALDNLPNEVNNDQYDGFEADATWRVPAAERIKKFRKADLNILVKNTAGEVVKGAKVDIKMLRHEFAFGSAINANKIAGNNAQNDIYQDKIINLDGRGHGFNWVVFENDMKWPAWETHWFVSQPELANAVQWLKERNIDIRGHNLVWPGADNMPTDISANSNNLPYIQQRIEDHLESILLYPSMKGEIAEWDVLNEITTNRSLENYFEGKDGYETGREILAEIFKKTRALDPQTGLWLNDYVTLSQNTKPGNANYDNLKAFTRELLDAGVDLEGIGFQGHIGGFPNGIPSVLETLDDFYQEFGLKAKITEFDMPSFVDEATAAQYLRDFMIATFSHESMDGFLFWSFWDGATWIQGGTKSNFFQQNWKANKSLDVFVDLVFNEWWTEETGVSSGEGKIEANIFKGMYEISYESNGEIIRDTLNIVETMNIEIVTDNISTSIEDCYLSKKIAEVFPNPASTELTIKKLDSEKTVIRLFDLVGKMILEQETIDLYTKIPVEDLEGIYIIEITSGTKTVSEKVRIVE